MYRTARKNFVSIIHKNRLKNNQRSEIEVKLFGIVGTDLAAQRQTSQNDELKSKFDDVHLCCEYQR